MIETVKSLVLETAQLFSQLRLKLVTAESCTGGGLSYWLTSVPGSSDWFDRGFVTYHNEAKIEMLDVAVKTIEEYGAVSGETAKEMAEGALRHSHAEVSIAITGIAGPAGGSADRPVGTVWIAWARLNTPTQADRQLFVGDRQSIRLQAMAHALGKLIEIAKAITKGV